MKYFVLLFLISLRYTGVSQSVQNSDGSTTYKVGYRNIISIDTERIYKPHSDLNNPLHFRPIEIDFWYPAKNAGSGSSLPFLYFLRLLQDRSNRYQDDTIYNHITDDLVGYLSANLKILDTSILMHYQTSSYFNAEPVQQRFPLIVYFCSYNGMSFENLSLFEWLASHGYTVACITSVGKYPGNMSMQLPDLLEQVSDGNFAVEYLKRDSQVDSSRIAAIGYSWGGLAATIMALTNNRVKTILSLDGSEMHYYGDSKEEDSDFNQIITSSMINSKKLHIPFAYLESGYKQEDQEADSVFLISSFSGDQLTYLQFPKATHEDFSDLSSLRQKFSDNSLIVANESVPYKQFVLLYFNKNIKGINGELAPFTDILIRTGKANSNIPVVHVIKDRILITGKIVDEKNNELLAFVNVGIRNRNTGTVSDQQGLYQLKIDPTLKEDSITFSMAGYQTRIIPLKNLVGNGNIPIRLKEKVSELADVVVSSKIRKTEIKGNTTTARFVSIGLPLKFLGSETGIKIHLGKKPVQIRSFSFNISDNHLDTAVFRLNIYNMAHGVPVENILHQNILVRVGKQSGLYTMDLKEYKLVINGDILLSLEWIAGSASSQGHVIFLSAGFLNSATWHRLTSQAAWKKASGIGVGFNVAIQSLKD